MIFAGTALQFENWLIFFLSSVQSMFILAISSNGHQETVSMRIKYTLKYQNWAIIFGI